MAFGRTAVAVFAAVLAVASAAVAKPSLYDHFYPENVAKTSLFDRFYPKIAGHSLPSAAVRAYDPYKKVEKLCYEDGERAIGAPGYPKVKYMPCCSGKPPLPMDSYMKSYDDKEHWGLWCGGTGKVVVKKGKCYADGERAIGAKDKPYVPYMPCCDGREPQEVYGEWGKFCGYAASKAPKPTVAKKDIPIRCAGEDGYPYVEYYECDRGYECARAPKYGWGFFCVPATKACYGPGVKGQGAKGYPAITYLPCCDGQKQVEIKGEWGKFCPGKKAPVYEAPKPTYSKPYGAPDDYKPYAPPKDYKPPVSYPTPPKDGKDKDYPVYPVYPTYPKGGKDDKDDKDEKNPLGAIFNDKDFGCSSTGSPAVPIGTEPAGYVASTILEITLPECDNGGLTAAQAVALLAEVCRVAQTYDPSAVCIVESVPVVRMLSGEDDMNVAVRQGGFVTIIVYWFIIINFAAFSGAIVAIFSIFVFVFQGPAVTSET